MIKPVEIIIVKLHNKSIGRLVLSAVGLAVFEYYDNWIQEGFSISPFYLPLQAGALVAKPNPFNGNFGIFADSLPDGWGNLLLDRILKKHHIHPHSITLLDRLSLVGSYGMGALCYEPDQSLVQLKPGSDLHFLAAEVANILDEAGESQSLELLHQQAGSSAGVRPKVMIKHDSDHWLVKFPSSSDPQNVGETEYNYSLLGKKAGLEMTETYLFEGRYFGVKRFDRIADQRIHIHSAAGLLYADYRMPSLDYIELIKATRGLTRNAEEAEKVYRLMVFNVLIGNKDDHTKNFSYIYQKGVWKCSPVYDLLPSYGFNGNHCTTIAGQGNPNLNDIYEVANQTSISHNRAKMIYEEVADCLIGEMKK
jgi:serine/threonine-protein kinase HipA